MLPKPGYGVMVRRTVQKVAEAAVASLVLVKFPDDLEACHICRAQHSFGATRERRGRDRSSTPTAEGVWSRLGFRNMQWLYLRTHAGRLLVQG